MCNVKWTAQSYEVDEEELLPDICFYLFTAVPQPDVPLETVWKRASALKKHTNLAGDCQHQ